MPVSVWDRVAPLYDLQLRLEEAALDTALDLAAIGSQERLLDVGTGTAGLLRRLADRCPRPVEAVGIDASARMLERAPRLPPGWRLVRGDATALPFANGSFEVVTAAYLLHLLDETSLGRVLSELRRVLVDGGRVVTVTPASPRSFLAGPYRTAVTMLVRLAPEAFSGLRPYDPRRALVRAGLEPTRGRYVAAGYPSLCVLARAR